MLQWRTILKLLGVLLTMFSISMWPPALVALFYQDSSPSPFCYAFIINLMFGLALWLPNRLNDQELKIRDGFALVILFWVGICLLASMPFMMSTLPHESLTDAIFESVSGFTTTGATVIQHLNALPHALRFYRQQLQFFGGMGIVVLAVAVLPMLGVGGMQLFRAETPGPMKESKLTPRITQTAKALWLIYVGLTALCALCYWLAGMSVFNAIGESFATVSTGGFSLHDTSFSFYNSPTIEIIAIVFMLLGSANFALHFFVVQQKRLSIYWLDEEFRKFCLWVFFLASVVSGVLWGEQVYAHHVEQTLLKSFFNTISLATTTGFVSGPFHTWPSFVPLALLIAAIIGGCAGSTSGGIKMIRALLLQKQSVREAYRLIHPNAIVQIKFAHKPLPDNILQAMWSFIAAFIGFFVILVLALMGTGLDMVSAFGASVASLANAGAAIGTVANDFSGVSMSGKWLLMFAMLAGRLEIFTLLVVLSPAFWRR